MKVFWLEQSGCDLPAQNEWLGSDEAFCLGKLRFAKRRQDWLLGRWTEKRALAACLGMGNGASELAQVEIRAAPSGQPEAFLHGIRAGVCLSLSHSHGKALCAIAPAGAALGCDLERIEPRADNFIADYFTAGEQAEILAGGRDRDRLTTLLWSAKESALKALCQGLRLDTRAVSVEMYSSASRDGGTRWERLRVHHGGHSFHGCWRVNGGYVRTMVASAPRLEPVPIDPAVRGDSNYYADFCVCKGGLQA